MDTQILKLDKPYNYIYCNGSIGLHIATLIVYEAKVNENGEYQLETHSHPVVRYRNSPDGTVWNKAELSNCFILCSEDKMRVSLKRFRTILWHQNASEKERMPGTALCVPLKQQLGFHGITVSWPVDENGKEKTEFEELLTIRQNNEGKYVYECALITNYSDCFFFYNELDNLKALQIDLVFARDMLYFAFNEHEFNIKFVCEQRKYAKLISEVNKTPYKRDK